MDVRIERLAALFPQPIRYESRRRNLLIFLFLPKLSVRALWFPIVKYWVRTYFRPIKLNRKQPRQQKKINRTKKLYFWILMSPLVVNIPLIPLECSTFLVFVFA